MVRRQTKYKHRDRETVQLFKDWKMAQERAILFGSNGFVHTPLKPVGFGDTDIEYDKNPPSYSGRARVAPWAGLRRAVGGKLGTTIPDTSKESDA